MGRKFTLSVCGASRPLHTTAAEQQSKGHLPLLCRRGTLLRGDKQHPANEFMFLSHRQHDPFKKGQELYITSGPYFQNLQRQADFSSILHI